MVEKDSIKQVKLTCQTDQPIDTNNNQIIWLRNGTELPVDHKIDKDNQITLVIPEFEPSKHNGEYEIRIVGKKPDSEPVSSKVEVKLDEDVQETPDFVGELSTNISNPIEGETVNIKAKLTHPLNPKQFRIDWYINQELADEKSRKMLRFKPRLDDQANEACLDINKMTSKDEGALVECVLFDMKQKKEIKRQSLRFEVRLKLLNDLRPTKSSFMENSEGELACEVNKKPLSITVYKNPTEQVKLAEFNGDKSLDDEKLASPDSKYSLEINRTLDGFKLKLKVSQLQPGAQGDAGKYWLVLNTDELTTNEANLSVKELELEFVDPIKTPNKTLFENEQFIEIQFKLNKKVPVTQLLDYEIQVLLNRTKLVDKTSYTIEEAGDFYYTIKWKNPAQMTDGGQYQLKLASTLEKTVNSLQFDIVSKNLFTLELPESIEVYEDEPIKLEVRSNQIIVAFQWYKNKERAYSQVPQAKRSQQPIYTFVVKNAKLSDAGVYEFVCEDAVASVEVKTRTQCQVVVKERAERQVKSLNDLGVVRVREGETINLTVKFDKPIDPSSIELFFNESIKLNDAEYVKTSFNVSTYVYTVQIPDSVHARDQGKYIVKSANTQSECQVLVEEKPLKFVNELENVKLKILPEALKSLESVNEDYSRTARFECTLSKPSTDVTWYINDEKVTPSDRILVEIVDKKHSLIIKNCTLEDSGSLVQIKLNSNNKASLAKLKVEQVLAQSFIKIRRPLEDQRVKENETATFVVELLFNHVLVQQEVTKPQISIDWTKNDQDIVFDENKYELQTELDSKGVFKARLIIKNVQLASDQADYNFKLVSNGQPIDLKEPNARLFVKEADKSKTEKVSGIRIIQDLDTELKEYSMPNPFSIHIIIEIEPVEVTCDEPIKIEWYHNDKKVVPLLNQIEKTKLPGRNQYRIQFNFNTPFVYDSGEYYCRVMLANSGFEARSKTAKIKIVDPNQQSDPVEPGTDDALFQTKPRFIEYFSDVYMDPGTDSAKFKCRIIGKPEPKIVWFCNCHKITTSSENNKYELIKEEADYYTLIIHNVNLEDEGEYTCKASNSKGETSWSANLYLNDSFIKNKQNQGANDNLVAPNFLRKIKDSTVSEGGTACFDCFIDGVPFPTIKWYRNNVPIDLDKSKFELEVDEDTGRVGFSIFKCSLGKEDQGEYMIKLENVAGSSHSTAYLCIETPLDDEAASKLASKNKRKVRFSLPKDSDVFLIPPRAPPLDEEIPRPPGEPRILDFRTTTLTLKWLKSLSDPSKYDQDGKRIENDDTSHPSLLPVIYIVEYRSSKSYAWSLYASNLTSLTLNVSHLIPSLTYSFRIRAENLNGVSDASPVASTKNLLDVDTDEPAGGLKLVNLNPSVPVISASAKDVRYYIEGQTAEVIIPIYGQPVPKVKWLRDGKELVKGDRYNMHRDRSSSEHFEIFLPSERDEGLYEVVAENEYGQARHEFYLQQADPPIFLEPFKDTTAKNHETVQLVCKVDGIPYPEVKFYKDWHLLAESSRIKIKHREPDTWIITITGAIVRDSGLYTCTAKNIAGGTLSSCNLNVVDSLLNVTHPDLKTELVAFKKRKFEEDYDIVEMLTQAPNSRLYRVIERRTAKEYVAKVATQTDYADWLKSEADCLNQIAQSAPTVSGGEFVKLHDAYETPDKSLILIFDPIKPGRNLIEHVANGITSSSVDEKEIAMYIKQLLECLSKIHSRNIVHLDVNPDNIVIDKRTKRVQLVGFTHAKCLKTDTFSNQALVYHHDYGQVEFVAPEVVRGTPITLNTDMWSVGVLVYSLLSGLSPFYAQTPKQTLTKIGNCEWKLDKEDFRHVSHEAKDFIQRLLLADPKSRMTAEQALNHPWIHFALQQPGHSEQKAPIGINSFLKINKTFYNLILFRCQTKSIGATLSSALE